MGAITESPRNIKISGLYYPDYLISAKREFDDSVIANQLPRKTFSLSMQSIKSAYSFSSQERPTVSPQTVDFIRVDFEVFKGQEIAADRELAKIGLLRWWLCAQRLAASFS